MGNRKKRTDPFERVDGYRHGISFSRLTEMQAETKIYQKLDPESKDVLSVCKLCRKYHVGYNTEAGLKSIEGNLLWFYFNRALQVKYGFMNPNKVRKALIELVLTGFIEVVEDNANTRRKNIYKFSDKWQDVEKGKELKLSQVDKTFIQGKSTEPIESILAVYRNRYKHLYIETDTR